MGRSVVDRLLVTASGCGFLEMSEFLFIFTKLRIPLCLWVHDSWRRPLPKQKGLLSFQVESVLKQACSEWSAEDGESTAQL